MKKNLIILAAALVLALLLSVGAVAADEGVISKTKDGLTANMTLI